MRQSGLEVDTDPRRRLHKFIHHPVTEIAIILLIVVSVGLLVVEYSLPLSASAHLAVLVVGDVITVLFGIELGIRYVVARKKRRFFRRYWADLLAILPLFRPLRFFRLVKLLRLFRLGLLLSRRVSVFRGVLRVNVYELWVLVVFTVITVIGAAVMAFVFEPRTAPGFETMEGAIWWALHSIIAAEPVGGAPTTFAGRVVSIALMLSGMALFAVFTGIVSATMTDRLGGREEVFEMDLDELESHIVICGWNDGVPPLLAEIGADPGLNAHPVVLVNPLSELPRDLPIPAELLYHVKGDHTRLEILRHAGVERASRAVVVIDSVRGGSAHDRDARSVLAALTIEKLHRGIFCAVELMDPTNESHLRVAGVEAVVMRNDLSGRMLATACRHPDLVDVIMELVSLHRGKTLLRQRGPAESTPFGVLIDRLKTESDGLVIGVEKAGQRAVLNPARELVVDPDDILIVISGARRGR